MKDTENVTWSASPFVSVIVVNYNGWHLLKGCLTSLESSSYPREKFEVIVVDNGSSDGTVEHVREVFSEVRIVQLDKNYGFCRPNNEGARIARGEYIVLLNNDTIVEKEWLSELVKAATMDEKVISCASKILWQDDRTIVDVAGGKITIHGGGFYVGFGDKDGPLYDQPGYTGFGCGAGVLVKKTFFDSIGGFDESYFAACEENDLGWKSWLLGYKVAYVPTAVMYHKIGGTFGTIGSFQPEKVYLITRNRLCNLIKNFELKNVGKGLIIGMVFDVYRAITYLAHWNLASVGSTGRAYFDVARKLPRLWSQRNFVQKSRRVSDSDLFRLGVVATLAESMAEEKRLRQVLKADYFRARASQVTARGSVSHELVPAGREAFDDQIQVVVEKELVAV